MSTIEQERTERAEWLVARRKGIGGSDSGIIAGFSKYKTPYQLYLEKRGESDPEPDDADKARGRLLEPYVRQLFADATGREVVTPRGMMRHPDHPWMLATLDGIADGEIVVDFKTQRFRSDWGEPGTSDVPLEYLCQVQHYMAVTGLVRAELAVYFGGFDLSIYPIDADAEFQAMLIDLEAAFWHRVLDGNPPDATTTDDTKLRWPKSEARTVEASPEVFAAWKRLKEAKALHGELETEIERLKVEIQVALGESDTLMHGEDRLATWKTGKGRSGFDVKRLAAENPELHKQYVTTGAGTRTFLLKDVD